MERVGSIRAAVAIVASAALLFGAQAWATTSTGVSLQLREHYDFSTIDWTASAPIASHGTWAKGLLTFHGGRGTRTGPG